MDSIEAYVLAYALTPVSPVRLLTFTAVCFAESPGLAAVDFVPRYPKISISSASVVGLASGSAWAARAPTPSPTNVWAPTFSAATESTEKIMFSPSSMPTCNALFRKVPSRINSPL